MFFLPHTVEFEKRTEMGLLFDFHHVGGFGHTAKNLSMISLLLLARNPRLLSMNRVNFEYVLPRVSYLETQVNLPFSFPLKEEYP